jgi:hypothetical protein
VHWPSLVLEEEEKHMRSYRQSLEIWRYNAGGPPQNVVISAVLLRLFKGHLYVLFFIESVMLSKWVKAGMLMQEPIHLLKMLIAEVT